MNILDLFSGGSHSNGAPTTEGPTDGVTSNQTRAILEGLSNAVGDVAGVVNALQGGNNGGRATQTVVTKPNAETAQAGFMKYWPLLAVAAVGAGLWFFFVRRK